MTGRKPPVAPTRILPPGALRLSNQRKRELLATWFRTVDPNAQHLSLRTNLTETTTSHPVQAPPAFEATRVTEASLVETSSPESLPEVEASEPHDSPTTVAPSVPPLSPRQRQVLDRLLAGDSEKQAARALGISPHTLHGYVKSLYRAFSVSSRGELLACFVKRPEQIR